jgi:hypothetical protein
MEDLIYLPTPVPDSIHEAAYDAAAQCGYDREEEVLLDAEIVDVRMVSPESVKAIYPEWLDPPCSYSPDEIVRVDWNTWAVPKRFDSRYEQAVIARAESIIVASSTLLEGEVFTYGLGPEYNWLEWDEHTAPSREPPESVFEALCRMITDDWHDEILEYADDDPSYLDGIHPKLKQAVAKVLAEGPR